MREELAAELTDVVLLGVLENIFTAYGRPGHEIVFVYGAELADPAAHPADLVSSVLDEGSPVMWQPLSRFTAGEAILYPTGLLDLLSSRTAASGSPDVR
jgi:hypothetical protein